MLEAYARLRRQRTGHGGEALGAALHRHGQVDAYEQQLRDLPSAVITEAVGVVRSGVQAGELADYCLAALAAAGATDDAGAGTRLVEVVWSGLVAPAAQS